MSEPMATEFWDPGQYRLPDSALLGYTQRLGSIVIYANQASFSLLQYQTYQLGLNTLQRHLVYSRWVSGGENYWFHQFESLVWQASQMAIDDSRVREAEALASADVFRACQLLIGELYRRVVESVASLQSGLLFANVIAAIICVSFLATSLRFHNKITLQRHFHLVHGSHPIDSPICPQGRSSLTNRGCIPAVQ